jgi:hypothetical protein
MGRIFTEPHSTKQIEDAVGWGLETSPQTLILTEEAPLPATTREEMEAICRRVRCPVLVIHGNEDAVRPHDSGAAAAKLTRGALVTIEGGGHAPQARDPVKVNLLLREFVESVAPRRLAGAATRSWTRALRRPRRALYVSSPIGLGHAQRDVAIADELRRLHPDLQVDWLAQHPVTAVLQARGERIHPASAWLANESRHAEMIEQVARFKRIRDRAIFVGDPDDIVPARFGPYFPLAHHFEQQFHVRHRLDRHAAGHRMDYATSTPETIAAAIAQEIGRPTGYRKVPTDGATRAATTIAELL